MKRRYKKTAVSDRRRENFGHYACGSFGDFLKRLYEFAQGGAWFGVVISERVF